MKNMLPLNVTVVPCNTSGYVKYGTCDRKASSIGRCAHVAAIILHLSDTSMKSDVDVVAPSTSKPCTWDKVKKRCKTPQPLHLAEYTSSKRKPTLELYN